MPKKSLTLDTGDWLHIASLLPEKHHIRTLIKAEIEPVEMVLDNESYYYFEIPEHIRSRPKAEMQEWLDTEEGRKLVAQAVLDGDLSFSIMDLINATGDTL